MDFLEWKCITWIYIKISLKFVPKYQINNIPSLVQIMGWRRPGDKPISETMIWLVYWRIYASFGLNELRPRQNGRHFPGDIFKRIFVHENVKISIQITLKFIPKGPINKKSELVQIMAWCQTSDKPLFEPMMTWFTDAYGRHSASMSFNGCWRYKKPLKWSWQWVNRFSLSYRWSMYITFASVD